MKKTFEGAFVVSNCCRIRVIQSLATVAAWAFAVVLQKWRNAREKSSNLLQISFSNKHFWLFDGQLSVVFVFMFYIIIGNLTGLDFNLVILFISCLKYLKSFFFSSTRIKGKQNQEVRNHIVLTIFLILNSLERGDGWFLPGREAGSHRQARSVGAACAWSPACLEMCGRSVSCPCPCPCP